MGAVKGSAKSIGLGWGRTGFPSNPVRDGILGRSVNCTDPDSKTGMMVLAYASELLKKLNETMQETCTHKVV